MEEFPKRHDDFISLVRLVLKRTIPRGRRTSYVLGLTRAALNKLKHCNAMHVINHFDEKTLAAGEDLLPNHFVPNHGKK